MPSSSLLVLRCVALSSGSTRASHPPAISASELRHRSISFANAELGPAPGAVRGRRPRARSRPPPSRSPTRNRPSRRRSRGSRPRPGRPSSIRDRRGVRPTAAGATLVEHAEAIFAQVDAAEAELAAVLGVRGGRLRVASFPSAGATLMPLAVATFRRRHPGVALTLAEGEPEEIAPRLRAGEFDLALLFEFPGVRERPGAGLRTRDAARGPDARRAARRPPARGQAGADARRPARPRSGSRPRRRARARATSCARAWRPGSSRT